MSKKVNSVEMTSGVDKLEIFLQKYFKHLLIGIGIILTIAVIVYGTLTYIKSSRSDKADIIGKSEISLKDVASVENYAALATAYDFLADYIHLTAGIAYITYDNSEKAVAELSQVKGDYTEFAAGMLSDLGGEVNSAQYIATSSMQPIWYYREILKSDKDKQAILMAEFKSKHPTSKLLEMLETWGI